MFLADTEAAPPQLLRPTPLLRYNCPPVPSRAGKSLTQSLQIRCPLCSSKRANFHCAECVINGDFVSSQTRLFERFSEKNLRLFSLNRDNEEAKAEIGARIQETVTKKKLKEDLKVARTHVKYYKHLIAKTLDKRTANLQLLNKLKSSNQRRLARLPEFEDKAVRMALCADTFLTDVVHLRESLLASRRDLRQARDTFLTHLHTDIFPIAEVLPCSSPGPAPDMMLDCLADAMRTSYIHGRWVTGDSSGEVQYRMVAPLLSGSGDYTPVYAWVATNKPSGGGGGGDPSLAPPAHTIAAGLALATQFTLLAAANCGVILPTNLHFQDFGVLDTSELRFARKVAKLNSNVVTLCLHLGIEPSQIRPCHTLHNLHTLCHALTRPSSGPALEPALGDKDTWVVSWECAIQREQEDLKLAQLEETDDSEGDAEAEGDWVDCDAAHEDTDMMAAARREEEEELDRRSLERQSSIVTSVSNLLWGLTQSPKSPKK